MDKWILTAMRYRLVAVALVAFVALSIGFAPSAAFASSPHRANYRSGHRANYGGNSYHRNYSGQNHCYSGKDYAYHEGHAYYKDGNHIYVAPHNRGHGRQPDKIYAYDNSNHYGKGHYNGRYAYGYNHGR